ncbi:hypothetical protein ACSBL2_21825 [Pedobacter sp. AW31-3R]|uniref:hypothetical protein n=1 Tax=Pedobacter sp. AW31-3R TaxID=3445781 RepID=UPI003FA15CDC
MKKYLLRSVGLLKVLTLVSFLLITISGDKISAFVFLTLVMFPFTIPSGASGVFDLTTIPLVNITINVMLYVTIYVSVFRMFSTSIKKFEDSTKDKVFKTDIIRCLLFSLIICFGRSYSCSWISMGIFWFFSSITFLTLMMRNIEAQKLTRI